MKRKKKYILIGLLAALLLIVSTSYTTATILFTSDEIRYDNATSGLQSTNLQSALDELYEMANDPSHGSGSVTGTRFIYRWSTTEWTNSVTDISSLTEGTDYILNTRTINTMFSRAESIYLMHNIFNNVVADSYVEFVVSSSLASSNGITSGTFILKGGDANVYENNKSVLIHTFGSTNCTDNTTSFECSVTNLNATVSDDGSVFVEDGYGNCSIDDDGVSSCEVAGPVSFSTDTWETIVTAVQNGNTNYYNVGDTKTVSMGSLGTHTLRIANKTTPSACSGTGYSQTACGFVLEFVDIISSRAMGEGGWESSTARTYVNNTVYNALPSGLKKGIIYTTVVSGVGGSNVTTTDRLYLLTHVEVAGSNHDSDSVKTTNTRKLAYYSSAGVTSSNYAGAIKKLSGTDTDWWLRSNYGTATAKYMYFSGSSGSPYSGTGTLSKGISPAFRIG